MQRRTFLVVAVAMTVVAAAVRLHNALTFPILGGYDAFAHFTYIWFLDETGRIPRADAGWEFFQPPLYYASMAWLWRLAAGLDGELRLRLGTAAIALLGLSQAAIVLSIVRRRFPAERAVQLLAAGSMLLLPMHLYSAGFLGNENLTAVLCSVSIWLLLWTLRVWTPAAAGLLGLSLGLAMLAKYTAIVVVATAFAAIVLRGVLLRTGHGDSVRPSGAGTARLVATFAVVLLSVCGWYYAGNIREHGTPFPLSREHLFLKRVEDSQLQGERRLLEYVLFDPLIVYRPQWPRGLSLNSPRPPGTPYSAMRESIPTGLYANTWFDGFGGVVLPPVTRSEASRRAGQLLLLLGLVPTCIVILGAGACLRELRRKGWDDESVVALVAIAAMAVVVVHGTLSVPTQAAVKATYLMPVSVAFAFLFAAGLVTLRRRSRRLFTGAAVACAALGTVSAVVFTHGAWSDDSWFADGLQASISRNAYGVVAWAAGERPRAAQQFEAAAVAGFHLGYENLAAVALEEGRTDAAKYFLLTAARLQPAQSFGTPEQRTEAIRTTQAEYANALAVVLDREGNPDGAARALERSRRLDPSIPESAYNLGIVHLRAALAGSAAERRRQIDRAEEAFARALELDRGFREARTMHAVAGTLRSDCAAASSALLDALATTAPSERVYPVETGPGDLNAAGLLRRRRIEQLPPELSPQARVRACRTE